MARTRSDYAEMQRELERQRLQTERAQRAAVRDAQREERERLRASAARQREAKQAYAEARQREINDLKGELASRLHELEGLLAASLAVDELVDLGSLRTPWVESVFDPGDLNRTEREPPFHEPAPLSGLKSVMPWARRKHEEVTDLARAEHAAAVQEHARREEERKRNLAEAQSRHDQNVAGRRAEHDDENERVDRFIADVEDRDPDALREYFELVLNTSQYPEGFPRGHRVAYVPESRQLVVELELPRSDVVPTQKVFRYVKASDEVTSTAAPARDRKSRYASALAQITLRTVHELFNSDRNEAVDTVVFNGIVDTMDPRTGQPTRPCLITLRTTREMFDELDLANVDPHACLRHLNAGVSESPTELAAVRPVLEFDMVDPRFVEGSDVLGSLDQRPNLMDLSPREFESLITNLFEKMGLEARETQPSRDGGVDCVAWDTRPVFGGKVVIQAKRYTKLVGVSAVRDLYGTMQNERANKGILVTTSWYGKASYEFASGKPLELLDRTNLKYLLKEHAGLDVRIEPPAQGDDPAGES
jgi:restriction system protein